MSLDSTFHAETEFELPTLPFEKDMAFAVETARTLAEAYRTLAACYERAADESERLGGLFPPEYRNRLRMSVERRGTYRLIAVARGVILAEETVPV
jgi:hypothetical protein